VGYLKVTVGRSGLPTPPPEIAEEVELYARKSGRTGTLHFVPFGGWFVRFSRLCDDPRMRLYQEGQIPEPPTEDVWIHVDNPKAGRPDGRGGHESPYIALDIYQMGAQGVREFLERGSVWSGRGMYASHEDALRKAEAHNEMRQSRNRQNAKETSRFRQRDKRRWRFKIPFLRPLNGWLDLKRSQPKDVGASHA